MRVLAIALVSFEFMTIVFGNDEVSLEYVNEYLIYKQAVEFVDECGIRELSLCLKERSLKYLDSLPNGIDIGGGLKIRQNEASRTSRQHASVVLPDEPKAREEALDKVLLERLTDYVRSHSFEYKMPPETVTELENSIEEGRKKKGGEGGGMRLKSMMILLQIKAAALAAIALKFIGLLAFKALLIGKIALTIASIIALKKLVEDKHHPSTYEIYAHPHFEDHGHFDRSFNPELAYRGREGPRSTG